MCYTYATCVFSECLSTDMKLDSSIRIEMIRQRASPAMRTVTLLEMFCGVPCSYEWILGVEFNTHIMCDVA